MSKVLTSILSDYGYNLVALPKEDIAPLLLLFKNYDSVSSAENNLQKLFAIADSPPPIIVKDKIVAGLQGTANVTFDGEAGVDVLDWLLQKLKMGKLGGKFKLDGANTVKISYENVLEDKVGLLDLDDFISGSEPDTERFKTFKQKLENSELYVVNAVLKSNSFSVAVTGENGQQANLEATIKGILDANVDLKHNSDNSITLKNDNATPVIFAFKAQQIIYDQKQWWEFFKKDEAQFHIKDQQGVILKSESDFPTISLKTGTDLIRI
jgi:hypothetical protein